VINSVPPNFALNLALLKSARQILRMGQRNLRSFSILLEVAAALPSRKLFTHLGTISIRTKYWNQQIEA